MGEENKVEEKKGEEPQEIVLKVDMHCEACARKVARCLKGFEGVENVSTDYMISKVVVKGKTADPVKVCERIQRKSGRKVELISPLPKPAEEQPKEEPKKEEEKKEEPPAAVTVVLNVRMHCDACAQLLEKRVRKFQGVESVDIDASNHKLTVKGIIDPSKLAEDVYKKTRKQVTIVKEPEEEKKEEEKKEDEKKDDEKKAEEEEDKKTDEMRRSEYLASQNYIRYHYAYPPPYIFSDENPNACSVM